MLQIPRPTAKSTLAIIFTFSVFYLVIWLWQRQPYPPPTPQPTPVQEATSSVAGQKSQQGPILALKNNQILQSPQLKVEGKTDLDQFIVIYSNDYQAVAKSASGNFSTEITLSSGLNLIELSTVDHDQSKIDRRPLTLYLDPKETGSSVVFAGSVKSIFDTLLTLTTPNGDKNVRTAQTTKITIPEDEEESKNATVKNVRIGDYAIALGNPPDSGADNSLIAARIEILRKDKPQNYIRVVSATIITAVVQNLFSVKNSNDGKIIELTAVRDSQIQVDDKDGKTADIARDKNAIVFYHQDGDKNIADLIYLIP